MQEETSSLVKKIQASRKTYFFHQLQDRGLQCISRYRKLSLTASLILTIFGIGLILLSQKQSSTTQSHDLIACGSGALFSALLICCCTCRSASTSIAAEDSEGSFTHDNEESSSLNFAGKVNKFSPFKKVPDEFRVASVA